MKKWTLCLLLALAGCSEQGAAPLGDALQGERNQPGDYLAYEHRIDIELDAGQLAPRLNATREACLDGRFGTCSLIAAELRSGQHPRGELTLRIVPDGIEPISALAAEGGERVARSTRAEDLAQAVGDNRRQHEQLLRQQRQLQQYQERPDLAVADLLALARELAALEVQLQALEQEAARQQQRLDTNLLTLGFSSRYQHSRLAQIGDASGRLLDNLTEGCVAVLEFIGYGLPFLVVLFPLALLLRKLWRRLSGSAGH